MYAVVTTGGKQYRVEAGSELIIERLAEEPGASITFDRVLLVGDGDAITVGSPTVDGASVSGTVLGEELGPKLIIFKFKQKVKYRRTAGHRQHLTRVRIDEISAGGKRTRAEPAEKAEKAEKAEAPDRAEKPEAPEATETKAEATETKAEATESKAEATETSAATEAPAKPARTRKPAAPKAKATADDADAPTPKAKPATRRRSTAKKAEAEE